MTVPIAIFSWQDHMDSRLRGKDERMKRPCELTGYVQSHPCLAFSQGTPAGRIFPADGRMTLSSVSGSGRSPCDDNPAGSCWPRPTGGDGSRRLLPGDEGLDFGQRLLVGLGDEPTVAKVPTKEVQPVGGQFAGQFPLKGADATSESVYFTSHDADSSDGLFAGGVGNFKPADISGHFRTFGKRTGVERDFEVAVGPDSSLMGVFPVINHHVASVALLDLSTSH